MEINSGEHIEQLEAAMDVTCISTTHFAAARCVLFFHTCSYINLSGCVFYSNFNIENLCFGVFLNLKTKLGENKPKAPW